MGARRDAKNQVAPKARSSRIDTRFEAEELRRVQKVAKWAGLPPSAFVRAAAMRAVHEAEGHRNVVPGPVTAPAPAGPAVDPVELHRARVEVGRVGTNLNQLTRLAHRGDLDLGELAPVLDELRTQLDEMTALLGGSTSP